MPHYPHPITGRQDAVRTDADWRTRIERQEKMLGYIICGAKDRKTGEPCKNVPTEGRHRCKKHDRNFKSGNGLSKYPPNIGYGMNLNQFMICRRCKWREGCMYFTTDDEDECKIEMGIYESVMALKDKYTIDGDYLQSGMLESIAFLMIHRYRAERAIAQEGMVIEEQIGAFGDGNILTNKRPHPLLKHVMDINKQINAYSKTMEFSPESIRNRKDNTDSVDAANALSNILKDAQKIRESE